MEIRLGIWASRCDDDMMLRFHPLFVVEYLIMYNQCQKWACEGNYITLQSIENRVDYRKEKNVKCLMNSVIIIGSVFFICIDIGGDFIDDVIKNYYLKEVIEKIFFI